MSLPWMGAQRARWRVALAAAAVIVVGGAGTAIVVSSLNDMDQGDPPAVAVPSDYRRPIAEAAESCPALTPARLAGQLMVESRFVADAVNGRAGRGLAGLTDDAWRAWQPWAGADRLDAGANVAALAHYLCHLAGQVQAAKIEGEEWRPAVAAYRSGLAAVLSARRVPDEARDYVDRVERYASWYARNTTFHDQPLLAADADETTLALPTAGSTPSPQASSARRNVTSASPRADTARSSQASSARRNVTSASPTSSSRASKPSTGGTLFNDEYHGCLSANRSQDGTHLIMTGCNASSVQHWEPRPDGTIRSSGLCMDAANAATTDFTPVQVARCQGNPAQLFRIRGKQIYSSYADKCVNVHYTPGEGTTIVLFSCLNQSNQYFRLRSQ
ncbi:ricin-type beta-trefoil lectin domain protein [Micromonospora rubida]|uniref:ricin-type beta-trefoil lectin domain protein n=1 Tax=Micromonospora rubida TaxID=2697657 RepID=UPI001378D601|nr:ricin-type beta-trefoil lectin domain protein [Micromonospora rubida]NBE82802.1 hypothetical protein [Micromonospora rubida]